MTSSVPTGYEANTIVVPQLQRLHLKPRLLDGRGKEIGPKVRQAEFSADEVNPQPRYHVTGKSHLMLKTVPRFPTDHRDVAML